MPEFSIKINGVFNLTDARYFAASGVEYIGFCIDESSPEYCELSKIKEIISWLEGPTYVLEVNQSSSLTRLDEFLTETGIRCVHLGEGIEFQNIFPGIKIFKNYVLEKGDISDMNKITFPVFTTLLNIGEIQSNYLDLIQDLCNKFPCFLDFPWDNPTDVPDLSKFTGAHGIILHGGSEEKVGLKNFDWMDDLFDVIS